MKAIGKLVCLLALSAAGYAELNEDNYTSQELLAKDTAQKEDQSPFSFDLSFEATGKAKFDHEKCKCPLHNIEFAMAELDGSMVFYYNECCKEGLLATLAYTYTRIKWKNPYFIQNHFDTVSFAIGGFTERAQDWVWKGEVRLNADVDYFRFSENLFWNIILGGRYAFSPCFGFTMGFIALTGMRIDRLYPILGIDWTINESWKLNLIYPTNISLIYTLNKQWSFDLLVRSFDERHRVGKGKERNWNRGTIEYRATGAELGVNYKTCNEKIQANFHVGEILGGRLRVSKRHHNDIKRRTFKTAPYIGGEVAGTF